MQRYQRDIGIACEGIKGILGLHAKVLKGYWDCMRRYQRDIGIACEGIKGILGLHTKVSKGYWDCMRRYQSLHVPQCSELYNSECANFHLQKLQIYQIRHCLRAQLSQQKHITNKVICDCPACLVLSQSLYKTER